MPADGHRRRKAQRFHRGPARRRRLVAMLGSPALDAMVARALDGNPSLEAARATLSRSQYSLRAGYGVFFPQVDARAGVESTALQSGAGNAPEQHVQPLHPLRHRQLHDRPLGRGAASARGARRGRRRAAVRARRRLRDADEQRRQLRHRAGRIPRRDRGDARQRSSSSGSRFGSRRRRRQAGPSPTPNVLTLQSQAALTAATIPPLEQKIDQASDLLATLSGMTARELAAADDRALRSSPAEDLPLSLPSQLVRQRPDVLIAEAQLHAANATIGVATAAMLPNLTLSAGPARTASRPASSSVRRARCRNVGAGLTAPDLPRRHAEPSAEGGHRRA